MNEYHFGIFEISISLISAIFWFARLEFNSAQNRKDIAILWSKHDDLTSELKLIRSSLNRIEGVLSVQFKKEE